ncbi:MAG: hypothetical protein KC502_04920 [Myxococcales bacterium]|nr:hypothetical protein [Myxococcales bacterium]
MPTLAIAVGILLVLGLIVLLSVLRSRAFAKLAAQQQRFFAQCAALGLQPLTFTGTRVAQTATVGTYGDARVAVQLAKVDSPGDQMGARLVVQLLMEVPTDAPAQGSVVWFRYKRRGQPRYFGKPPAKDTLKRWTERTVADLVPQVPADVWTLALDANQLLPGSLADQLMVGWTGYRLNLELDADADTERMRQGLETLAGMRAALGTGSAGRAWRPR